MKRTTWSLIIRTALIAGLFGWFADSVFRKMTGSYLYVGAGAGIGFALVDIALVMWAFKIHHRLPVAIKKTDGSFELKRSTNPLPPLVAARTAAIAMAATRTGAVAAGFYAGFMLYAAPRLSVETARTHFVYCVPVVAGSVALVAVGIWLERRCSPPTPPTESATVSQ